MKVLLLQNAPWAPALGGANKHNRRLLEALAARGHVCAAVAAAGRGAPEKSRSAVDSFHLAGVDVDAVADGAGLREHAERRIRSFGPDRVLVASEDPAQVLLETALAASPGRVVYLARTTLGLPFGPQGFLPSARRTALLRKTAAVVAVSRYLQGYIRQWSGIESVVLPLHEYGNPPSLGRFDDGFATLVNPCAVKGISIFLELARRLPDVAFAAVPTWGTTAADRAALEELANVRILPPSEDVDMIFAATRVLLVPSLWGEAFGAVSVEAMLRGIPVLASDAGGLREAKLGVDHLLPVRPIERYREALDGLGLPVPEVPAQDVTPWEEALRALLADRDGYERLSWQSREAAQAHAAAESFDRIEAFLEGLTPGEQREAVARPRSLRILLAQPLAWTFIPGGAHKANRSLLEGLAARGHACRVVAPGSGTGGPAAHAGVEVCEVADGRALRAELLRQIRSFSPDWVVVSEDPTGGLLEAALQEAPGRVAGFAHSPSTLPFGPESFEPDPRHTELWRRTAGILTVSRWMAGYIRRWSGIAAHAVYSPSYGPGPFRRLARHGAGFVTCVNPSGIKGLPIVLELARRLPHVRFAAVPTWSTTAADRALLAELPNVTLLPPFSDVDDLFALTQVLLVPSLWAEAFGQIAVEAMLRGVPVLASDAGGLPEAKLGVDHVLPVRPLEGYERRRDDRGFPIPRIPPQDVAPWAEALTALLADGARWERLAEASFRAATTFAAGLGLEPYERFFTSLVARPEETEAARPLEADAVRRRLDEISPEKLELLKRRLAERQKGERSSAAALAIPRQPRGGGNGAFPLSYTQLRMWLLDQLEPGKPLYNESFRSRLRGRLSPSALAASLGEIVRRHEALRTRFEATDGEPVQVVSPAAEAFPVLPLIDLRALPEAVRDREAERLARDARRRPFDLARLPLLRMALVRLAPEEHHLLITLHHIAADVWAIGVMARELSALYGAFREGKPSPLPELPVQYADFAVWQRQWLAGARLDGLLAWWRERLAGLPPVLDLPGDRPRPAVQSFRGASVPVVLPAPLAGALRELARQSEATLFMTLLAGFQALLQRWSGQDDLAVGSPIANRGRRELEALIGCFINTLVLRGDLSGRPTGRDLLSRTREAALGAFAHQDLPFELLVERLQPERSLSHGPLFQVLFLLHNAPPGGIELPGVEADPLPPAEGVAKLDLTLSLAEAADGTIRGALEFSRDRFDAPTAARLTGHLCHLLGALAADPERPVGEHPLLSEAERHQLLREWNDSSSEEAEGAGVHELIAAQARRSPGAPAVAFQDSAITYAELAARASCLAGRLRALGCGPETRVGVALERSLSVPVALLGVLESGAAYVPLDPGYPRERLALVMEDASPRVLITEEHLLPGLPPAPGTVLCLDGLESGSPAGPGPAAPGNDLQLAYVLYTSGSTGRPKSVGVPHRALANFLGSMRRAPGFSPGQRLLAVTSLAFDIAALEIFLPLTTGGCVELASREEAADGALLVARLRASGAGVLQATPATWRMLLAAGWAGDPDLVALCGGEALPRELAAELAGRTRELWNLYGPTETTVWSATARVHPDEKGPVSIGPPIANTRIHLLDRELQTVPLGVPGELCIGGTGLARGYLGRPDLTAERFVPDPSAGPGARLYRTGDLARHLPGGRMEVLGRLDHQVKVRGFRIELGEIEAALLRHPGIREAVVALRDSAPAAYLVPVEKLPTAGELRDFLRARLPEPMIPAAFVALAALPLTPNRKVDRRALPAPAEAATAGFAAPRTPVEEVLAGIWAEVLGRARIGVHDRFFDLGGHSLLATRVISRLRGVFGVELPMRVLFERQTVAELSAAVEEARRGGAALPAPPLVRMPLEVDPPLSFAQQRLWFLDQLEPGSPLYNIAATLRIAGPLRAAVLSASLGEVVRRHQALRTVFAARDGRPVQVIRPAAPFLLPVVDLAGLPSAAREARLLALAAEEAVRPFDLARGPLLRGVLLRLGEDDHAVALAMHHIASDGWSIGILVREVSALHAALAAGRPSPLPELPVQYADFAVWQRTWLQGATLEREIDWWRRQLAGLPPVLELPTDRPRPAVQSYRGATRPVRLPAGLVRQIEALGRREGATLFMVLLAAFQTLLARSSGQDDLAVGSPVAGRNRIEIEGSIGFFVNTLVLRSYLAGAPSFRELVGRVRETALAAYLHQDVPFEKLVETLAPERSLAHTPLFQAMLALQDGSVEDLEIGDLRLRQVQVAETVAKLDLTLGLSAHGGGLDGALEHATDLFDAATVSRLAGHFERLLAAAVAAPEQRAAELPLLSAAERHQLLAEWSDTQTAGLADGCLHEDVAAQAARTPAAIALETESERWTYSRLVGSARRLARHLRDLGVGPDAIVGLCAERSPALVVGMLAILEAGGAWLPLDPTLPVDRLAFLLDDAGVRTLLLQEPLLPRVPAEGRRTVLLDARWDAGEDPGRPLRAGATPGNLAYVIYTSGSTGRPKGVMVPHRGVCNRLRWSRQVYGLDERDAFLHKASSGFDVAVWECFAPLTAGARLVLARPGGQGESAYLVRAIREHGVTLVDFVPSMLAAFLAEEGVERCVSLRRIFVGGEELTPELRDRALARLPVPLDNLYGPTEISIDASRWACAPGQAPHRVPIGRPIANCRLSVVDPELRPVPVGVAGELLVGGAGVTRGYLRRPALTAERFIPDPWDGGFGARSYRTGDLVRWRPDGSLDFLGRLDHQVKVRGFRIEPGEIEAVLSALPGIREATVVVREQRLVAYVAGGTGDAPADELRRRLRERLPDYMVPAAFVTLAALPRTPNGKLDRRALPAPDGPGVGDGYVAPRTPVEEILAGIWAEVLGVERAGAADSFFDLGGHSLLAAQVLSRLRSAFGVELPLRDLFAAPRLADLAARIEAARRLGALPSAPPLLPVSRNGDLPLSFAQHRLWFIDQLEPGNPQYNMPAVLRAEGPLAPAVLARCLGEIVRRHEALRTVFVPREGAPVQVIRPAAPFLLPLVDLTGLPGSRREAAALALAGTEAERAFDLARDLLLRGLLLRLAPDDHVVTLTLHHIASDGWSLGILVRELGALHAAFSRGLPSPLPELPVQLADFAAWQRRWLDGEGLAAELGYWRKRLAGAPATVLPADLPHRPGQPIQPASLPAAIGPELTRKLAALARGSSATLFMSVLAGFQAVLALHTGRYDVVTGANVANRNRLETEGLIGCFIDMIVLRVDLSGDPTFEELLHRVRAVALEASSHQDLPFDRLVQELEPGRAPGRTPLFQIKLDLLPAAPPLELSGLRLRLLDTGRIVARYDLHLSLQEEDGGLGGHFLYDAGRISAATVTRLATRLAGLLAEAVRMPGARLSELAERLDAAEAAERQGKRKDLGRANLASLRQIRRRPLPEATPNLSVETDT